MKHIPQNHKDLSPPHLRWILGAPGTGTWGSPLTASHAANLKAKTPTKPQNTQLFFAQDFQLHFHLRPPSSTCTALVLRGFWAPPRPPIRRQNCTPGHKAAEVLGPGPNPLPRGSPASTGLQAVQGKKQNTRRYWLPDEETAKLKGFIKGV